MNFKNENNTIYAYIDNQEAGHISYQHEDNNIIAATHTFIDPSMRGKNIAGALLKELVQFAQQNNLKIRPVCSYVVAKFAQNGKYNSIQALE